jgi:hypothetical protein
VEVDAAACGWFADVRPCSDVEFTRDGTRASVHADLRSAAVRELDDVLDYIREDDRIMDDTLPPVNRPLLDEGFTEAADHLAHADDVGEMNELDPHLIDEVFAAART